MNRTKSIMQRVCFIVFATLAFAGVAHAGGPTYSSVTNYQVASGNGIDSSTRLNAHDRAVLMPSPATGGACYAVLNNSNSDIFIPWKTMFEWNQFYGTVMAGKLPGVTISGCCAPQTASVCGVPYPPGSTSATATPLGYRTLGTPMTGEGYSITGNGSVSLPVGDVPKNGVSSINNWGAETDILGPLAAPAPSDYQVTYVCSNSQWVQTHAIGSCTPTNGSCSTLAGTYFTTLPSDTSTLCAAGSVLANLQTTSTGWSWTCDGTQGMSDASCLAYNEPPVTGQCGPIENTGSTGPTYTIAQLALLEIASPDQICTSGTFSGSFTQNNATSKHLTWSCNGSYGGSTSSCEVLAATVAGACGSDNGQTYTTLTGNPPSSGLCKQSTETVNWISNTPELTGLWSWTCSGIGGGAPSGTCTAAYNANLVNGGCGSANGGTFADGTLSPTASNLCSAGTVATFAANPGQVPYWTWSCAGISNGSTAWCSAYDEPQVTGQCGPENHGTFDSLNSADPTLCTSGTLANFSGSLSNSPYFWAWNCNGAQGGSTSWCAAYKTATLIDAQCGPAAGTSTQNAPALGSLCTYGNPSGISTSSNGLNWLWSCVSLDGNTTTSCSSNVTPPFANGACGSSNGTAIPNTPNANLCLSGTASTISGTGPWTWTCLGTSGGTNSNLCTSLLCNACTGTTTINKSVGRSGTSGSCNISGTAAWTEVDALIAGSASPATVSWIDVIGSFSTAVIPAAAAWPTYCPPCYTQAQAISNATYTVTGLSGSCGSLSVGSVLTPTNITVTPQ